MSDMDLTFRAVTRETWGDLAQLFEARRAALLLVHGVADQASASKTPRREGAQGGAEERS